MQFRDQYHFLSNFYPAPIKIGGITYPTTEHYYQSQKTNIRAEKDKIIKAATPGEAKRLGKTVTIRSNWENEKLTVMRQALVAKFNQHTDLKERLVSIPDDIPIIENNNWHDNYWGICQCGKCDGGHNHLGNLLTDLKIWWIFAGLSNDN
jgi:hypothetical protein